MRLIIAILRCGGIYLLTSKIRSYCCRVKGAFVRTLGCLISFSGLSENVLSASPLVGIYFDSNTNFVRYCGFFLGV